MANEMNNYYQEYLNDSSWDYVDSNEYDIKYYRYFPYWHWHYPIQNPTEQAYQILKKLIEREVIPEPKSYKKFCELLEAIKEVV